MLLDEADRLQLLQDVADEATRRPAKVLWDGALHMAGHNSSESQRLSLSATNPEVRQAEESTGILRV